MKTVENDEDKHSKKKNKKKQAPCLENDNDNINRTSIYATSVDEPKTMTSLLQKSAQNSSTNNSAYKYPTESSYFTPWHVPVPNLIVTLSSGKYTICTMYIQIFKKIFYLYKYYLLFFSCFLYKMRLGVGVGERIPREGLDLIM